MIYIRLAKPGEASELAELFLRSFKMAVPSVALAHDDDDVKNWYETVLVPKGGTWVAEQDGDLLGFVTVEDGVISQLYLDPQYVGQGLGTQLLDKAKELSPGGLRLYTFQANIRARRFYESRGFRVVDFNDGDRNEEGAPDVLFAWPGY